MLNNLLRGLVCRKLRQKGGGRLEERLWRLWFITGTLPKRIKNFGKYEVRVCNKETYQQLIIRMNQLGYVRPR